MTKGQLNTRYDVFHAYLVEQADYAGELERPKLRTSELLPEEMIPFSKAVSASCRRFDAWVAFYEQDRNFERLWRNPRQYESRLKKFQGVISPDFSLYRNMPLVMQMWNTYRGRTLAVWLQQNGVPIIPNVRFNDERTYAFCFEGIEAGKTVSVGTHGCIQHREDREYFKRGLAELVRRLSPKTILVYGMAPDDIFAPYREAGIRIVPFTSEILKVREQVTA